MPHLITGESGTNPRGGLMYNFGVVLYCIMTMEDNSFPRVKVKYKKGTCVELYLSEDIIGM